MHVILKRTEDSDDEFIIGVEAAVFRDHVRLIFEDSREDLSFFPGEYYSVVTIDEG